MLMMHDAMMMQKEKQTKSNLGKNAGMLQENLLFLLLDIDINCQRRVVVGVAGRRVVWSTPPAAERLKVTACPRFVF